jgi:scyllo-inositol 2-dehydrogenase (NADP+)
MGIFHQASITAHPDVKLVAVCDAANYVLALMEKCTGVKTYSDYRKMIDTEDLDRVFIATPSRFADRIQRKNALESSASRLKIDHRDCAGTAPSARMRSRKADRGNPKGSAHGRESWI